MIRLLANTFLSKIAVAACKLVLTILVARYLGPEGKGIFSFITRLIGIIVSIVNFSIGEFYIYINNNCPENIKSRMVITASLFFGLIIFFTVCIIKFIGFYIGDSVLGIFPFLLMLISGWAVHLNYHQSKRYQAQRDYNLYIFQSIAVHLLMVIFGAAAVILIQDVFITLYAVSAGYITGGLLTIFYEHKKKNRIGILESSKKAPKDWLSHLRSLGLLKYSIKVHLIEIFVLLQSQIDVLLLGYLLTFSEAGIYVVGVTIAQLTFYFSNSITTILFPEMVKNKNSKLLFKRILFSMLVAILINIPLIIVINFLIENLFGSKFQQAEFIYYVLLPGIIADLAYRILYAYLKSVNEINNLIVINSISLILNIVLNFILIPKFGIYGAAISSLVSYIFRSIVVFLNSRLIVRKNIYTEQVKDQT